ncbi:unnamed protein product [Triticum turgidum subsp. durum]|uniref:rRNA 2'-O-methyltransferase fibrillarin n=1 Tax=Triticum turgidum subsp. durum TaxID=4567 RepID=A0A9R0XZS9_TRITD|nr:unnamed protein product [Triticum turgidum subsp. durum]
MAIGVDLDVAVAHLIMLIQSAENCQLEIGECSRQMFIAVLLIVQNEDASKVEFRAPGTCVLYLGAAFGATVSHVSDIVGPTGLVYAIEFSHRSGRDLVNMAKKRTNVIPITEDARHPAK